MSRLKPFPAQKWPLILHLVMLSEDFDTQAMIEPVGRRVDRIVSETKADEIQNLSESTLIH